MSDNDDLIPPDDAPERPDDSAAQDQPFVELPGEALLYIDEVLDLEGRPR